MDFPKPVKPSGHPTRAQVSSGHVLPSLSQLRPSPIKTSPSKKLEDVRIIQRTLVFVINLPSSAADEQLLLSANYFGKYGRIIKIHLSTGYHNAPDTTFAAYLTYSSEEEAAICIRVCHDFYVDGKRLALTFGTTKYCSYFLKNVRCPKLDCVFLHYRAAQEDTIYREEMNINRHIQPSDSVFDRLKVLPSPPVHPSKLPEFRVIRERAASEIVHMDTSPLIKPRVHCRENSNQSRYNFAAEEGDFVEIPQFVDSLRQFASPCKEVAFVPRREIEAIIDPLSPLKWFVDVMDVNLDREDSGAAIVSMKLRSSIE